MTSPALLTIVPSLTAGERHELLWLARESIRAALRRAAAPGPRMRAAALEEPSAAFVSLHVEQRLRGCVGTVTADRALYETVVLMARSAAFDDPRFGPLTEAELMAVEIEISRLSALVPVRPEQVEPGIHGLCLRCGEHRAVFLPQVATTQGWDRATLLAELCAKALLPADAWAWRDAELLAFTAEVFGERAT